MSAFSTLTLVAILGMPVSLQQAAMPKDPSGFIIKAAEDGLKEVEVSKMAMEKTQNEDVKAFARRLVTDHSIANDELLQFSKSRKITLKSDPTAPMKADPMKTDPSKPPSASTSMPGDPAAHAAHMNLMNLQGAAFDKAYIAQMVTDHKKAVELFDVQSDDGQDAEIKVWADKKLATLREHLKMAKDLQEKIGK
jgi:putative membrane protein